MSDLTQVAGTPLKVTIREKEYELYPITIDDYALLKQEIKSNRIKLIMDSVTDKTERMDLITQFAKEEISINEMKDYITSMEGNIGMLWLALRHTGMTRAEVGELIGTDNFPEVSAILLSFIEGDSAKKKVKKVKP